MSFNKVIIQGNLGQEVEHSVSKSGTSISKFSVAVDCGYGESKTTSWVRVVCFGKVAENVAKYLSKGSACLVEGELKLGSYDHKDGHKVNTAEVVSNSVQFLGGKSDGSSAGGVSKRSTVDAKADMTDIDTIDGDAIPF